MAALSEESANIATIETLVMMDTALCYRLLQLVNSVLYGLNSRVTSIRNALVIVGSDEFRKLVTVSLAGVFAASQSKVLVSQALERARFLEMLAPRLREEGPKLYLLGMLSLIDAILKVPMSKIIDSLPLDDDMKAALTGNPSKLGVALDLIQCYQVAEWDACDLLQQKLGLDEQATAKLYMDAVHWADVVIRQ
jgi:EAL and modified HD-GYP domain-containing signal transduction protein